MAKTLIVRGGEYKCRVVKMNLKLRHQQLKTTMYIYIFLYINLIIKTNQKSAIDTHTQKKEKGIQT